MLFCSRSSGLCWPDWMDCLFNVLIKKNILSKLVDIKPETWNQIIEIMQDWSIVLENKGNAFFCPSMLENAGNGLSYCSA